VNEAQQVEEGVVRRRDKLTRAEFTLIWADSAVDMAVDVAD
jgi:hypothetical protein